MREEQMAHVVTKSSSLTSWTLATGFPMTMFLYFLRLATVTVGIVISLQRSTTKTIRNVANVFTTIQILAANLDHIQVKTQPLYPPT